MRRPGRRASGRRLLTWSTIGLATFGCSRDSTGPPPPAPSPTWVVVDTLVGSSTLALEVDPGGEWLLVVEGDGEGTGYRLFDLDTGEPLGPLRPLGGVTDVAVSLDGAIGAIVGAGLPETTLLSISAGDERERVGASGDLVERHPTRDLFYVAGGSGVFRIDRGGAVVRAERPADTERVRALGVSGDGSVVYVFAAGPQGSRIVALDAETMALVAEVESPVEVQAFVPLESGSRMVAIGTPADRPFRGPVWTAEVDARSGGVGPVKSIADGLRSVEFSATSPRARIDAATVLVPSTYGVIAVDPGTGGAVMLPEHAFEGLDPCCAIAWDPDRSRLYVTGHDPLRGSNGRVVAYERGSP